MPRAKKTFRRVNGEGTVYNLGGNRRKPWVAKYPIRTEYAPELKREYRQVYKTIGYFESRDDALLAMINYKSDPSKFVDMKKTKEITFLSIFNMWSEQKFKSLSKSSVNKYKWAFSKFEELYQIPFVDIKLIHLQKIIDKEALAKGSLHKYTTLLHQLYAFAMMHDITDKDYSQYLQITNYKKDMEQMHKPFTDIEIKKLWDNINIPFIDTILIMIYTGYRPSEMLNIKIKSIDLKNQCIHGGSKTKAGKERIVPIHSKILPLIKARYNKSNEYLIQRGNAQYPYANYHIYIFKPLMIKLDMNHRPHDGRHTFATLLSNSNANSTSIMKMIGHANYSLTEDVYIHKDLVELKKAIEKIGL